MSNYETDTPVKGLNILSFFIPLVGLILFCVFLDSKPNRAKSIGKCALYGFVLGIVLNLIRIILIF